MHVHIQPCGRMQAGTYGVDTPVTRAARQHFASRMTKLSLCNPQSFVTRVPPSRTVVTPPGAPGRRDTSPYDDAESDVLRPGCRRDHDDARALGLAHAAHSEVDARRWRAARGRADPGRHPAPAVYRAAGR